MAAVIDVVLVHTDEAHGSGFELGEPATQKAER